MNLWTPDQLGEQFRRADAWRPLFEAAATANSFPSSLLLAIASRETNLKNIRGDFHHGVYHGYGLMQVDIRTDPTFCHQWTPDKVAESINRGTRILAAKRAYLTKRSITDLRAIVAAYNTGEGNVAKSVAAGLDPDRTTAGGEYGKDVMERMAEFEKLIIFKQS